MKKLALLAASALFFVTQGLTAEYKAEGFEKEALKIAADRKPGSTWITLYNNSPEYIKVKFHVGKNKTQCFYSNRKVTARGFFRGWIVTGKEKCEIAPGEKVNLFARWGSEVAGPTTYKTIVAGKPKGIIFETQDGEKYYLSHRDESGDKILASLLRNVEIRPEKEAGGYSQGGLKERWYSIWGNGSWNSIPKLKEGDLKDYY